MSKKNGAHASGQQLDMALPEAARSLEIQYIARSLIEPDPQQPREEPDADLRDSIIREGILQAITVRPNPKKIGVYLIVDGERRWKGAEKAQNLIPCIVRQDQGDEQHRLITQLVANTGKPLAPTEEAKAFGRLMELSGKSVTELSDMLGRPRSTLSERLSLLDVGPWLDLIDAGEISVSHVVRAIAPLKGVTEDRHREAIAKIRKDYRWNKSGISFEDFERVVDNAYALYMYPLQKGSSRGYTSDTRPTFDTKNHNKECDCGRVRWKFSYSGKRDGCCNPDWWRTPHRKALAAKKKRGGKAQKRGDNGPKRVKYLVPEGTKALTSREYHVPDKYVALTNVRGSWDPRSLECDPNDLDLATISVAVLENSQGNFIVATNPAELKSARNKWETRWDARVRELGSQLLKRASRHEVKGPGAVDLVLTLCFEMHSVNVFRFAGCLGIEVPAELLRSERWNINKAAAERWASGLSPDDLHNLLGAIATLRAEKDKDPNSQAQAECEKAANLIASRNTPWMRGGKPAKPAATNGKKSRKPKPVSGDDGSSAVGDSKDPSQIDALDDDDDDDDESGWDVAEAHGEEEMQRA